MHRTDERWYRRCLISPNAPVWSNLKNLNDRWRLAVICSPEARYTCPETTKEPKRNRSYAEGRRTELVPRPFSVVSLINPECLAWKPLLFVLDRTDTANFIANWTPWKHAGHLHANPFISLALLSSVIYATLLLRHSAQGSFCTPNSSSRWKRES